MSTTSNTYHLKALIILAFIYVLPLGLDVWSAQTDAFLWALVEALKGHISDAALIDIYENRYWIRHVLISILCIRLLFTFVSINLKIIQALVSLEVSAMVSTILASKMQWFNTQFETIMSTIFFAEIAIVVGSATLGPIFRVYDVGAVLRKLFNNVYTTFRDNILGG